MFSETLNTVSTLIFITFFIKCMKEGQKVRFSATKIRLIPNIFSELGGHVPKTP